MPFELLDDEFTYIKAIIAAYPGGGKTRFASQWPNVVYADAEGRLLSLRGRQRPRWKIESLKDLWELKQRLDQPPEDRERYCGVPVETLCIDTLDEVVRIAMREREAKTGHLFGKDDWGWLAEKIGDIMRGFRNIEDLHVLFSLHLKKVQEGEGGPYYVVPQISGQMTEQIFNFVDIALLLERAPVVSEETGEEYLEYTIRSFPDARHDWIKDHSGTIPNGMILDFETDYQRIAQGIFGDVPPARRPAVEIAAENFEVNKALVDELAGRVANLGDAGDPEGEKAPPAKRASRRKATTDAKAAEAADALRSGAEPDAALPPEPPAVPREEKAPEPPAPEPVAEVAPVEESPEPEPAPVSAEESVVEPEPGPAPPEPDEVDEPTAAATAAAAAVFGTEVDPEPDDENVSFGDGEEPEVGEPEPAPESESAPAPEPESDEPTAEAPPGVNADGEVVDAAAAIAAGAIEAPVAGQPDATDADGNFLCEECQAPIFQEDQAEISRVKLNKRLCPEDYQKARAAKKAKGR